MKIIKKINTSAAVALDSRGNEIVVFGKGIGFPQVPYELTDLSQIQRSFYEVDPMYYELIGSIPEKILLVSSEITENAEEILGCELNPNLSFTLADHLNFAISRIGKGISLSSPISYDIRHLYPKETQLAKKALVLLNKECDVDLPEEEAVNIAMHLINAETEVGDMHSLMESMKIINDITGIIEKNLNIMLDRDDYSYARFVMHIRYLIQRFYANTVDQSGNKEMLKTLAKEFPEVYFCAFSISDYLKKEKGWECTNDEILYLMMHIQRVRAKTEM